MKLTRRDKRKFKKFTVKQKRNFLLQVAKKFNLEEEYIELRFLTDEEIVILFNQLMEDIE